MTIPGIGPVAAVIISEIGTDMSFFPSADHLASRAGLAPANNESGGRRRPAGTRHGNQHLANVLVECAWSCSRTKTRPGAQFHGLVRRFGGHRNPRAKKKAGIPTGRVPVAGRSRVSKSACRTAEARMSS
jgi:transposase